MIDIKELREDPEDVIARLASRGVTREEILTVVDVDERFRQTASERDRLRGEVNRLSKSVGEAMRSGDRTRGDQLKAESRLLGESVTRLEGVATELEIERHNLLLYIPNIPSSETPVGATEEENVVLRYWSPMTGDSSPEEFVLPTFDDCKRKPHWEVGEERGLLDLQRAAKIAGSMFAMYRGDGARMLRALTTFALNEHADAYEEVRPPTLVKRETMVSTGHLPKFAEDAYEIERDDLFAIPTAEVPLTSLAKDEILDERELPVRLTAATACFRREAGSAGRDTRGLLRLHEFDKVELLSYCTAEQAAEVHADILARAEGLLRKLGLTYRVLDLCTGDLGASSKRTFDLEAYSPGTGKFLEVSSVSWFGDYQARRANIRYRGADGEIRFVNTLNGSALAWARIWAVIVETYRQADGTIAIPDAIQPYMGNRKLI